MSWILLIFIPISGLMIFNYDNDPLLTSGGFGLLGLLFTVYLVPKLAPNFKAIGLKGKDMSKVDSPVLAESMGAISSLVYFFSLFFFIPFLFYKDMQDGDNLPGVHSLALSKMASYLSAVLSLICMFVLGMADDLFDIRWRNKFFLPAIAALPLLVVYFADYNVTYVNVPRFLEPLIGAKLIDLGVLYYVYMASVAIFCPNCINIYAGINGLEVGQAVVLALCVLANDVLYIVYTPGSPAAESHLFSAYLLIPFIGVSLGLLYHNWWPASVFVGDTYCYVAGMVLAVVGILGHFSKTLLLFFLPQIINFIYSVPQLFKLVPCPRHRLPKFNREDGLLYPSVAKIESDRKLSQFVLRFFHTVGLLSIREEKGKIVECSNLTLINLALVKLGPMREDKLASVLLLLQLLTGILAIALRHSVAAVVFGRDNF